MKIAIITDYLGRLGSKQKSKRYRQGMDIALIEKLLMNRNIQVHFYSFHTCLKLLKEKEIHYILYNSSEDPGEHYKSFIEDQIRSLSLSHHTCIPNELFLRAHNNKVFMEMLRIHYQFKDSALFASQFAATIAEFSKLNLNYPIIMKGASGALSRNVQLIQNKKEGIRTFNKMVPKVALTHRVKELIRRIRHGNNYSHEAIRRGKVVLQNYIPNILFDWKVLIYFDTVYVLKRNNRPNDFRASGSGLFSYEENISHEILDLAWETRKKLNVPHLSLDIAMTKTQPIIFEFQVLGFGTKTMEFAPFYFKKVGEKWSLNRDKKELEEVYVASLVSYLKDTINAS